MKPKRYARLLAGIAVIAAFAMVAPVAQAVTPKTGYTQFAGCPSPYSEDSKIVTCIRTDITGGHFQMGNKDVPISKPLKLVGGVEDEFKGFKYNSEGGLSKVQLEVPGGVIGLTGLDWLVNFLNIQQLKLYAVTELAGTPTITDLAHATLPIKVHLINTALGNSCYVGSDSNPIALNLTTETTSPPEPNKPISGQNPKLTFDPELEILKGTEGIYVDNSFAAPGANGCVLTLFGVIPISLNAIVNVASGLPSAAGKNETIQNFGLEIASSEFTYDE